MTRDLPRRVCLLALLLCALTARAQAAEPRPKTDTSGLALSVGYGHQYPFLGAQAAFYLQVPRSLFRVVPYVGGGLAVCGPGNADDDQAPPCTTGGVVGVMGSWGDKHRLVLNAFYGTILALSLNLHGTNLPTVSVEGFGLAIGYEYMAFNGFFVRGDVGVSYHLLPPLLRNESRFGGALTLIGIGYKLW